VQVHDASPYTHVWVPEHAEPGVGFAEVQSTFEQHVQVHAASMHAQPVSP
jgi:hypothetical protein